MSLTKSSTAGESPACIVPAGLPSIEELAINPPFRRYYEFSRVPPHAECERALNLEPGDPDDTLRQVFIAARIHREGDAEDKLTFDFFLDGDTWPVALRSAILRAYPRTLYFEHRLAAIAACKAALPGSVKRW